MSAACTRNVKGAKGKGKSAVRNVAHRNTVRSFQNVAEVPKNSEPEVAHTTTAAVAKKRIAASNQSPTVFCNGLVSSKDANRKNSDTVQIEDFL